MTETKEPAAPESPKESATAPANLRLPSSRRRGTRICDILLQNGHVTAANVRRALKIQEERGGQIGRILVAMGACSERAISRALLEQVRRRGSTDQMSLSEAARNAPSILGLTVECSPTKTVSALIFSDLCALFIAMLCGFSVQFMRDFTAHREALYLLVAAFTLCVVSFPALNLYSAMALSEPDELRASTSAATISLVGVCAVAIFGDEASRLWTYLTLVVWWAVAVPLVPLARALTRAKFANESWWGHPVIVLGAAKTGRLIVRTLKRQPSRGLRPVIVLDDDTSKHGTLRASFDNEALNVRSVSIAATDLVREAVLKAASSLFGDEVDETGEQELGEEPAPASMVKAPGMFAEVEGVPVVGDLSLSAMLAQQLKIKYAIVAMPSLDAKRLLRLTERVAGAFSHMMMIPDLFGLGSIGAAAKDVGGVLGIEVRQQLLLPGPRLAKRTMDLALTLLGGIFVLPIMLLLSLLIILDSRGGAFYQQKRLGRNGTQFMAYKFRSMHGDGEERLAQVLASDPALRAEYEKFHKLRNDPRVTRVGRILRKFSLDELPQLINVLKGDMSLVGPRPYLEREIKDMDAQEGIILRATPGMTGLWQVSDRNNTSFAERVTMDVHYVRNWSPWMDINILARTFRVVVKGTGM